MASIKRTIAEGILFLSLSNIVVRIFSLVGYAIVVGRLDLHDYGVFALLTTLVGPASLIVFFGFGRIFVSDFAKARGKGNISRMKGLVREFYGLVLFLFVGFVFGSYFLRNFLVGYYDIYVLQYFWQTSIFIVSQLLFNMVLLFLEANEDFKYNSILSSLESFSRGVLIVVFMTNLSVERVLIIYALAKFIAAAVGLFYFIKLLVPIMRKGIIAESKVLINIFKAHGKWEMGQVLVRQIIQPVKLWIIKIFVNVQGVAIFDFSQNIYSAVVSLAPVNRVIFPVISRVIAKKNLVRLIISKAQKYTLIFYALVFGGMVLGLPFLINLFFSQYSPHLLFIYFVLLHLFTQVYRTGQSAVLYGLNQQKFFLQIFPVSLVLELVLYIVFTNYLGIWGAVISWHLQVLIVDTIVQYYLIKKFGMRLWSCDGFFTFDHYDKIILEKVFKNIRGLFQLKKFSSSKKYRRI